MPKTRKVKIPEIEIQKEVVSPPEEPTQPVSDAKPSIVRKDKRVKSIAFNLSRKLET